MGALITFHLFFNHKKWHSKKHELSPSQVKYRRRYAFSKSFITIFRFAISILSELCVLQIFYDWCWSWMISAFLADMFLVGTAMLIFGVGLYVMFIQSRTTMKGKETSGSNLLGIFHLKVTFSEPFSNLTAWCLHYIPRHHGTRFFLKILYLHESNRKRDKP